MESQESASLAESIKRVGLIVSSIGFETIGARLRRRRLNQGISVRTLAEKSGVNKNSILRLERGQGSHPATLISVCEALSLHLDSLSMEGSSPETLAAIQRCDAAQWHNLLDIAGGTIDPGLEGAIPIQLLSSRLPLGRIVPTIMRLTQDTPVNSHHGEEFVFMLSGEAIVNVAGQEFRMKQGDSICFWSGEMHQYLPVGGSATLLSVRVDY